MRDPERLEKFYEEIKKIHKDYFPDWRFGQLMMNFLGSAKSDPFFWEENRFIENLKEYAKANSAWKRN
jgi:hypothetical protein